MSYERINQSLRYRFCGHFIDDAGARDASNPKVYYLLIPGGAGDLVLDRYVGAYLLLVHSGLAGRYLLDWLSISVALVGTYGRKRNSTLADRLNA